jgi:peroxiredoxin
MTSDENAVAETKKKRPVRRWIANLLLILAVFIGIQWWQARPLASGPAPDLKARLVTGEAIDLGQYRGKTVLVHFWAEWCPVCRAEQGNIQAIAEDFPVVTIAMQSGGASAIREHMAEQGIDFATIADPRAEISGAWGVTAVPTSFVVDPEGVIRFTAVGYTTEPGLRTRLWLVDRL